MVPPRREIIISSNCFRLLPDFASYYCRMSEHVLLHARQKAAATTSRHHTEGKRLHFTLISMCAPRHSTAIYHSIVVFRWRQQVNQPKSKTNSLKKMETQKMDVDIDIPTTLIAEHEYQESNSGSYSTTTTLSMQKTDLIGGKPISIPPTIR